MGVDYDGVGGIGVEVTKDMIEKLIEKEVFTEEEWSDDSYSCLERIGLPYAKAGDSAYGGEARFYLLVNGSNLKEILSHEFYFIKRLEKLLGIFLSSEDLIVIEDILVY